jgi:hypothetical protein
MADDTKTFTNVTRAQAEKLRSAIAAYVTLPDSDSGAIESHGVKGSYAYNETAQTLTLSISEAPFFVPRAMVWSTIERALQD